MLLLAPSLPLPQSAVVPLLLAVPHHMHHLMRLHASVAPSSGIFELICLVILFFVHFIILKRHKRQHAILEAALVVAAPRARDVCHAPPEALRRLARRKTPHHPGHAPHCQHLHNTL